MIFFITSISVTLSQQEYEIVPTAQVANTAQYPVYCQAASLMSALATAHMTTLG